MIPRSAALALLTLGVLAVPASAQMNVEAVRDFGPDEAADTLVIRSTTDIAAFALVLDGYISAHPDTRIHYEQWGSNNLYALARAACTSGTNGADLVISSAIDLQLKLVNDGCAQPNHSAAVAALSNDRKWRDELFGITQEPAVMIYNKALVPPDEVPRSRFDLIDLLRPSNSRYAGKVATYDIEESGLGYLFAFVDSRQATTFGRLLEAFGRSGAVATCCSAEIISAVAKGKYLLAYNVLGSYALARAEADPRIGVTAPSDYTLLLSRAALIPKGARHAAGARQFVDYMLSDAGRRAMRKSRLIVTFGDNDDADIVVPGATNLRPIEFTTGLLAGLDQDKHKIFVRQWRANLDRQ